MNDLIEKCVPFTLFYLWKTQRLPQLPVRIKGTMNLPEIEYMDGEERVILDVNTTRILRSTISNLSTGTRRVEDVGYTLARDTDRTRNREGSLLFPIMNKDNNLIKFVYEWRITASGAPHGQTVIWAEERNTRRSNAVPRHIVFTDRGWIPTEYFIANPHLKLYRPYVSEMDTISNSYFREVNRETMDFSNQWGFYDSEKMVVTPDGIEDKSHTVFADPVGYIPLSQAVFELRTEDQLHRLRAFTRPLVKSVVRGEVTESEANSQLIEFIKLNAKARSNSHITACSHEFIWRAFYLQRYRPLPVEVARVVRSITNNIKVWVSIDLAIGSCRTCEGSLYAWNQHESLVIDRDKYSGRNVGGTEQVFYCSEEHAQNDTRVFKRVDFPEKYSYHTDVLGVAKMGASRHIAPNGALRRVGIELETFHLSRTQSTLPDFVVGGSIKNKHTQNPKKYRPIRNIKWAREQYIKWGAIPTRDGSLNESNGVEWVFRPSGLNGLCEDVTRFLTATKNHIAKDATETDYEVTGASRTYGLHVHVTQTDIMEGTATRARIAVVAGRLSALIHKIGKRGYSNYTRRLTTGRLVSTSYLEHHRRALVAQVKRDNAPAWMKYIMPLEVEVDTEMRIKKAKLSHEASATRPMRVSYHSSDRPLTVRAIDDELFNRYNMVNVSYGRPTIELRHAKSIADKDYILLNAELAQAVVLFGTYEVMSIVNCLYDTMPAKFAKFVWRNSKDYPRLATWLLQNSSLLKTDLVVPEQQRTLLQFGA